MKHTASRELYRYWDRVRGGEPAPRRGAIEPSDIRSILADTFILEVISRNRYQVRLAGTRVCSLYCREIKGTEFLDLWQSDDKGAVATLATAVSTDGAAAVLTVDVRTARGNGTTCELLFLPLRHGGLAYDRILGCFSAADRPYWVGSEPIVRQSIAGLRLIWPDQPVGFGQRESELLLRPVTPAAVHRPERRRRGHLFVVDGGKGQRPA
jgi:hypothetical protein